MRSQTTTMLLRERKQQVKITCVWLFQQRPYEQFYKLLFATSGEIRRITLTPIRNLAIDSAVLLSCSNQIYNAVRKVWQN